jgi:hypothetical protein
MITIKKLTRESTKVENQYTGAEWRCYTENESEFFHRVEAMCNEIGAGNILSIQFIPDGSEDAKSCIVIYKDEEETQERTR